MTLGVKASVRAIGIACLVLLGACGDDGSPNRSDGLATTSSTAADHEPAAFPVTVTGANGDVTIASRPGRIVVLSATLTESVFAVGAGAQVIAVDSYSDFPSGAPRTDLSAFHPNVEAIGKLEPDLVLLSRDRDDVVAALTSVGIAALVLPSARDLDEVYRQIETIGVATGHASQAATVTAAMRDEIQRQLARLPAPSAGSTYFYELSGDYSTITSHTFVGSILDRLGMVNVADGVDPAAGAYPQLSAEYVLDADPTWVFLAHADGTVPTHAEISARPGWDTLGAVTAGRVVQLDVDVASRWGPRTVELVAAIVDALAADRP